jgi:glyoxylase-like metal-dependent hydrolase (beta-lactamase superfamily II)
MLVPAASLAQTPSAEREPEITTITGDLYRVRDGQRDTVFLVTLEGIILGDPLSYETATWLKAELTQRFPDLPVRYVLHTHHHFDRAEGAAVFTSTAEVVAHRKFADALSSARNTWPEFYGIADRNGNRVLDAAEMADSPRGALVRAKDRDGNGRVRPDELYFRVQGPETTYDSRRTIVLGGRTVELVYTGNAHAPDMTALYFPAERVVFVADPPVKAARLPLVDAPRDVKQWLEVIGQLDFELGVTGDAETFSAASIHEISAYFTDLVAGVVAGRALGQSLAEIQSTPFLDQHASKPFSTERASHIAAVYRTVRLVNVEISAAAIGSYAPKAESFCEGFTTCGYNRPVALASIGLGVSGTRMGLSAEFTAGDQSWNARTSPFYDEEFAARQSRAAVLFRYHPARRRFPAALVAGMSVSKTSIKGMSQQKESFARAGGRRPFGDNISSTGITGGVDMTPRLTGRIDLVIPVRVTHMLGDVNGVLPSRTDIQAGIGLRYGFVRRVN